MELKELFKKEEELRELKIEIESIRRGAKVLMAESAVMLIYSFVMLLAVTACLVFYFVETI